MELLRKREGMIVYRDGNYVVKESKDSQNQDALANAYRFFQALCGSQFIPIFESYSPGKLVYGYVEETPVTDTELARRNTARLLHDLRQARIIHGDLTAPNFVFRNNVPVVFDWDQSIFMHEPKPQKRPKLDAQHIWPAVVAKAGDPSRVIRRWVACIPHIEYYFGWGNMVDLGTHMGDFPGMASAQGLFSVGVDGEYIRPCIKHAESLWHNFEVAFKKMDIVDFAQMPFHHNIIMMFSTWPYIIQQHGQGAADVVIQQCIDKSDILLFETQYAGDGPGPDFINNDSDAVAYVKSVFPAIEMTPIISLPVDGREATRTTWKIIKVNK